MRDIKSYLGYQFESSSTLTPEFAEFARLVKHTIKKSLPDSLELVSFNRGHFYFSGFIKNKITGKYAYFNANDVRGGNDDWYNRLLIRTAENDRDYTGGVNGFYPLTRIADEVINKTL